MRTLSRLSLASFTFALAAVACGAPANDETNMNTQPIGVGAVADVDATVDLEVCGSVDLYVAATANVDACSSAFLRVRRSASSIAAAAAAASPVCPSI